MSGEGRERERERGERRRPGYTDRIKRVLRRSICYSGSWIDGSFAGKKKFHRVASSERFFYFYHDHREGTKNTTITENHPCNLALFSKAVGWRTRIELEKIFFFLLNLSMFN